jgi:hypothetical protein
MRALDPEQAFLTGPGTGEERQKAGAGRTNRMRLGTAIADLRFAIA